LNGDDFTLENFKNELQQIMRPGVLMRIVSMLPGMGSMRDAMNDPAAETELQRMLGIIASMTREERQNPKLLDDGRRKRICRGAGVQVGEIKALIKQFDMMAPLMKAMAGKGMGQRMKAIQDWNDTRRDDRGRFGL